MLVSGLQAVHKNLEGLTVFSIEQIDQISLF